MTSDRVSAPRGEEPAKNRPRVFISYSHDSEEHLERVRALADRLRTDGVEAWIDQYEQAPAEGWSLWMQRQIERADFVLCVCTEDYRRRFDDQDGADRGRGVTWEAALARTQLYLGRPNARFFPVLFDPGDAEHIPTPLADFSRYLPTTHEGYEALYRLLTAQPKVTAPPIGKRQTLDPQPRQSQFGETLSEARERQAPTPPRPDFRDEHAERVSTELEKALRQRDTLLTSGAETKALDTRILDLKRDLRIGPQLQPGEYLADDRYQLIKPLGQGGFATVWLAQDRITHEQVAIKVLHGQFSSSEERRERLFRGARQMAKLQHEHIVPVFGEPRVEDGWAFFAMEYLPGGDFRHAVLDGQLSLEKRLELLQQVAGALDHAHRQGVVHRDVKPGNILLDAENRAKLADFDLVRAEDTTGLTRTRAAMGSYLYAAPESMENAAEVTTSCDIYSMAATLVFAIRGVELSTRFLLDRSRYLEDLKIPGAALAVLREGLGLQPQDRPDGATELCRRLRSTLGRNPTDQEDTDGTSEARPRTILGVEGAGEPKAGSRPRYDSSAAPFWSIQTLDGEVPLWAKIPAGTSWVGSPEDEVGRLSREGPRHAVEVTAPFWMAVVPVTNSQYAVFDPSRTNLRRPNHPVVDVSWDQAMEFCRWLEVEHGFQGARLPTEEEWEYACRADKTTRYWSGDAEKDLERVGWYAANSEGHTHPVGEKLANPWGIYDAHGNVWEWTASRWKGHYGDHARGLAVDPTALPEDLATPQSRAPRVIRGGSYWDDARYARAAYRNRWVPRIVDWDQGFRVLLPFAPNDPRRYIN